LPTGRAIVRLEEAKRLVYRKIPIIMPFNRGDARIGVLQLLAHLLKNSEFIPDLFGILGNFPSLMGYFNGRVWPILEPRS
jgi:hypothetical protein